MRGEVNIKAMDMKADASGWITELGEVKPVSHAPESGLEQDEIHHVDIALDAFGDHLDYPGRAASHYTQDAEDYKNFWSMYGEPAKDIAYDQGWILWGNSLHMHPQMFFANWMSQPPAIAVARLEQMIRGTPATEFRLEWQGDRKVESFDGDKQEALELVHRLRSGVLEDINEIKRLAGIEEEGPITEGRMLRTTSEFVYDIMMIVNSAREECARNPEELDSKLRKASGMLDEILHGRGR